MGRRNIPRFVGRLVCEHDYRRLVVHAVEGGHRAHCLSCGALGAVRENPEAALAAVSSRPGIGESLRGSSA